MKGGGEMSPLAQRWIGEVRNMFLDLKRGIVEDGNSTEQKPIDTIQNYANPFSYEEGLEYSIGKNDLRSWGTNMSQLFQYTPSSPYSRQDFVQNISILFRNNEYRTLALPAYIDLENAIRKEGGETPISIDTIAKPDLQPLYILAIMASVSPKEWNHIPILA
jgi:hypothetical protein